MYQSRTPTLRIPQELNKSIEYYIWNTESKARYVWIQFTYSSTKNRNIYQLSSWSTGTAFEQVIPLQLEHARVHCKSFLRHLHLLGVWQPVSQPQCIVSKRHSGAAGLVIMSGLSWLFLRWNPYNKGSSCTPSHSCIWRKALRECWYPESDVGGSFSGDM